MYISKQVLAWVFVAGGGLVGWLLYLSSDDPVTPAPAAAVVAEAPTTPAEGLTLRLTIVTPEGEKTVSDGGESARVALTTEAARASATTTRSGRPTSVTNEDVFVLAHDGAVVFVGDDGTLKANTGDASSSGAVTFDSVDSTLSTGTSDVTAAAGGPASDGARAATGVVRSPAGTVVNEFAPHLADRAVAVSGYENHSVNVAGDDQIVTYDDSNVFVDREGLIHSNTGDTDSSGLNAMDVVRSFVRSGDSADAPPGQEPEEPEEDAAEALAAASGGRAESPVRAGSPLRAGSTGSASVTDDDGGTSAQGRDPLVIGGDGYDDLGIRSSGDRNIVTYDDSNVVVGGTGAVASQIGDADTGGAVVMRIIDSHVEAGDAY